VAPPERRTVYAQITLNLRKSALSGAGLKHKEKQKGTAKRADIRLPRPQKIKHTRKHTPLKIGQKAPI
jgi:hypothetical protein